MNHQTYGNLLSILRDVLGAWAVTNADLTERNGSTPQVLADPQVCIRGQNGVQGEPATGASSWHPSETLLIFSYSPEVSAAVKLVSPTNQQHPSSRQVPSGFYHAKQI